MLALHYLTPPEKRFWTHAALILVILYATFVTANYVVQLATVIPAKLRGASEAIRVLVYFYPTFSTRLLFLGFPWAITAPLFMLMLALLLRRRATAS